MAFDNHVSDANDDDDSHDGDTDDGDDVDDIQSERMAGCDGNMAADVPDGATNPLLPGNMTEGVVMIKMVMVMIAKMMRMVLSDKMDKGKQSSSRNASIWRHSWQSARNITTLFLFQFRGNQKLVEELLIAMLIKFKRKRLR